MQNFKRKEILILTSVIFVGIVLRVIGFADIPSGLNQDEAFAGYEAFSLLNFGVDSAGYTNPCYFVSWGSGMNVLESYLAIPFVAFFGNTVLAIRLPMLICSVISLPVFYLLLKELTNIKTALIGVFVLSVCPWHIMLSRFGLESNLAPAFLLFGFYFLVKGIKNNRWLPISACLYGISLYSYSITWIVVPFTLVSVFIYLIKSKQKLNVVFLLLSVGILFLIALPLILFLLVNINVMNEIVTPFISIPKLVEMRGGEISPLNLLNTEQYYNVLSLVIGEGDSLLWNTVPKFGMYYIISVPFILIGFVILVKRYKDNMLILIGFVCSFISAVLISGINVNKANHLHIYSVIFIAVGIEKLLGTFKENQRIVGAILLAAYLGCTISFMNYYLGEYNSQIAVYFNYGLEDCVSFVNEKKPARINVDECIYHSQIMYFDETDSNVFKDTVVYQNYPSAYLKALSFGKYDFGIDYDNIGKYDAYIIKRDNAHRFENAGYEVERFGEFAVAYK